MLGHFFSVANIVEAEIEIEKSRFIAKLFPARTVVEAVASIESVRKEHFKATHVVPAYIVGESYKYSDDGEPAGTAGAPIFSAMKAEGFNNIAITVTRYFGGTKLGKGGLVRAYTKGFKSALEKAFDQRSVILVRPYKRLNFQITYPLLNKIERKIQNSNDAHIEKIEYNENVDFKVWITPESFDLVLEQLIELTDGSVIIKDEGISKLQIPVYSSNPIKFIKGGQLKIYE